MFFGVVAGWVWGWACGWAWLPPCPHLLMGEGYLPEKGVIGHGDTTPTSLADDNQKAPIAFILSLLISIASTLKRECHLNPTLSSNSTLILLYI